MYIGRGAMHTGRSHIGRGGGLYGRENAGISSERGARNVPVESLRFPGEGSSAQGKSGPKSRPNGVDDGQQVEIPVLPYHRTVGTRHQATSRERKARCKHMSA